MATIRTVDVDAVGLSLDRVRGLVTLGERYGESLEPDTEAPFLALWEAIRRELADAQQQMEARPEEGRADA